MNGKKKRTTKYIQTLIKKILVPTLYEINLCCFPPLYVQRKQVYMLPSLFREENFLIRKLLI